MRVRELYAATDGCVVCGEDVVSKRFCRIHLLAHREKERARVGGGAWRSGGPGRPPTDLPSDPTVAQLMDARDRLRRAAAGCSVPAFPRRITALCDAVGIVLNDFLRATAAGGEQSEDRRTN
jgi:hypothetical protein